MAKPALSKRILFVLLAVPLLIALCYACILNANMVSFTWWPFAAPLEWPLFVFILSAFAVGFLFGNLLTRLSR